MHRPIQPVLNPAFPTYGKLLRAAGYQTPSVGKWHVSVPANVEGALHKYGFDYYKSYSDPTGANLQGTYGDPRSLLRPRADITTTPTS